MAAKNLHLKSWFEVLALISLCFPCLIFASTPCDCSVCGSSCSGNINCNPGQFLVVNGSEFGCFDCPTGHYCPGGKNSSKACPE
ncbi:unnamed protein product, partial [Porites evermanni]